jgi:hypothetical protein
MMYTPLKANFPEGTHDGAQDGRRGQKTPAVDSAGAP